MKITIIIPTYNSASYLKETLNAVISQTYSKWQCVLVDDGSTDETLELIKAFTATEKRIKLLSKGKAAKGANASRNIGLYSANTPYVMFVDADDILLPSCIAERLATLQENSDKDMLIFKTAFMNAEGQVSGYFPCVFKPNEQLIADFIDHKIQWQTMSVLWKRDFLVKIGGWDEGFERLQDVELNVRALLHQPRIKFVNKPFDSKYRYLLMTTSKKEAALYGFARLIKKYYVALTTNGSFSTTQVANFKTSFTKVIYNTAKSYVAAEKVNLEWVAFFIAMLQQINFDEDKRKKIESILNDYHDQ